MCDSRKKLVAYFDPLIDASLMLSKPGTYILVLRSRSRRHIAIGRWGDLAMQPGYYLYVGSAFGPGGVAARVLRHWRQLKAKRWHIDYLREYTTPQAVWYSHAPIHLEHGWAETMKNLQGVRPLAGFGCSDCACQAHLFFTPVKPALDSFVEAAVCSVQEWPGKDLGS